MYIQVLVVVRGSWLGQASTESIIMPCRAIMPPTLRHAAHLLPHHAATIYIHRAVVIRDCCTRPQAQHPLQSPLHYPQSPSISPVVIAHACVCGRLENSFTDVVRLYSDQARRSECFEWDAPQTCCWCGFP
jgi:hypothetical protein